uniref:ORF2 n=1 Tax=Torque teno Leptonychotes weddellii virus-1 TaxID=2012676 RepID=A0A1Z2RWJ6_9VIRU|nr:ORF2 [Torque teno Leptonychotes weddellii virus 1]
MALSSATSTHGYPDLHHPLQYRKQEALWKQNCSIGHKQFCACGDFLSHFKWPSGEKGSENQGDRDGETGEDLATGGGEDIEGATLGDGDITDLELLQ